jgi:hypothetical protein
VRHSALFVRAGLLLAQTAETRSVEEVRPDAERRHERVNVNPW